MSARAVRASRDRGLQLSEMQWTLTASVVRVLSERILDLVELSLRVLSCSGKESFLE
jgi:hypothetical protein